MIKASTYVACVLGMQSVGIDGMELLRLLQWVLAGVGVFIVRVGFLMVKSINSNTDAVAGLAKSIERLIRQHESQATDAKQQVADSTALVMNAVAKGFSDVRTQLSKESSGGPGGA